MRTVCKENYGERPASSQATYSHCDQPFVWSIIIQKIDPFREILLFIPKADFGHHNRHRH